MIGEKIIQIMSEIKPIQKTELDEEKNYKFAKSEEIIGMVNPLLVKYKVIIVPLKVVNFLPQGNKVFLTMKYQFIDVEDPNRDCIEIEIPGSGYDEKGRAVYAALTGAYRYAMQEMFAIPVIDEIKNDKENSFEDNSENRKQQEENITNDVQNDGFIGDVDIQNMDTEDLDKLFASKEIA